MIDPAMLICACLLVEQEHSNEAGKRIDQHRVVVGKPDARNRVHYCRMNGAEVVYLGGVPFDPQHEQVIEVAKRVYKQVVMWLERDFTIWRGLVAMPEGLVHTEGIVPHNLLSLLEESEE